MLWLASIFHASSLSQRHARASCTDVSLVSNRVALSKSVQSHLSLRDSDLIVCDQMVCETPDVDAMGSWRRLLPYYASGRVVAGFGRGGKQLNCPTGAKSNKRNCINASTSANLDATCVAKLPSELPTGVYYGWAVVNNSPVYPMCMSIGYNPQFNNKEKTMEVHILHNFIDDFYDATLRIVVVGWIRSMTAFNSLGATRFVLTFIFLLQTLSSPLLRTTKRYHLSVSAVKLLLSRQSQATISLRVLALRRAVDDLTQQALA